MKLSIKIARTELRNLFYSPVAWFLSIAFLVQCAIFYSGVVEQMSKWQELIQKNNPNWENFGASMTTYIFLRSGGIFSNAVTNLYLFLPLLTMGLISREINNGTIKLLYSSPIKSRHIVFGKYIAIMVYNLLLVGIVGIFMITGLLNIAHVDTGLVLTAALGFYLLVCAFTAIGLFMSSLTTYQIVSAIATFMVIFILSSIGGLWQKYDFVRDLTYFLSMNGRVNKMMKGLITTNDVIYFLLIIYLFLSFTLFKLRGARESKPWFKKALRYIGALAVVLLLGYISTRPGLIGYWDTTRNNINTIHPNTQEVVNAFEKGEQLEVTLYANLLGSGFTKGGMPETRNDYIWTLWEKYLRFKPEIKFNYVNYYDLKDGDSVYYKQFPGKSLKEIAGIMAEGFDVNLSKYKIPEEIRKEADLQAENVRLVMKLTYKGRSTWLRTFDDPNFWPDETNVSAAFKRLQQPEMPKMLFTYGNLERNIYKYGEREFKDIITYKDNRKALINIGIDCDSIDLDKEDIPANTSCLLVADPKTTLSVIKQEKIRKFINAGGNMFFFGEPGKQDILNPVLSTIGVQLTQGTLIELSEQEMPHMTFSWLTAEAGKLSEDAPLAIEARKRALIEKGKEKDTFRVLQPGVAEVVQVSDSDFRFSPLLATMPGRAFNKLGPIVVDSLPPVFTPENGDTRKNSFATLAVLSRTLNNKEQRILVSGDADFMSNSRGGGGGTADLLFTWLDQNRFPIFTPGTPAIDTLLTISAATGKAQSLFFIWILPSLVLLLGTIILVRRKRK